MKKHTPMAVAIASALGILVLILDAKTALSGAAAGVELCIRTVIPSLFPFFFLSVMLTATLVGRALPPLRWLGRLLRLPEGAECIYITGLLGGYPVGAQNIAVACKNGQLTTRDGRRMLTFCSNPGPAFLFGIGSTVFADPSRCWLVWAMVILSSLAVGMLTPGRPQECRLAGNVHAPKLSDALRTSVITLALVCGWVVIFRVILAFADRWFLWLLAGNSRLLAYGFTELSNGCCALAQLTSEDDKIILYTVFLCFGGLCVLLQTDSVMAGSGVDPRMYLPGKLAQTAITFLLSCLVTGYFPWFWMLPAVMTCVIYRIWAEKFQNSSRNRRCVGV